MTTSGKGEREQKVGVVEGLRGSLSMKIMIYGVLTSCKVLFTCSYISTYLTNSYIHVHVRKCTEGQI